MSSEQEDALRRKVREARERQAFKESITSILSAKEAQGAIVAQREAGQAELNQDKAERDGSGWYKPNWRRRTSVRKTAQESFGTSATAARRKNDSMARGTAAIAQARGGALPDIAEAGDLPGQHDIGAAADGVQAFPAGLIPAFRQMSVTGTPSAPASE